MRILFVVPYAPSLIRVRPYQLLRALARRGHQIVAASMWTNEEERRALEEMACGGVSVVCERMPAWASMVNCLKALPTGQPLQSLYSWQPSLMARLARLVRETRFDVVHVEHVRGVQYGIRIKRLVGAEVPVVWDSVDCISQLYRQASRHCRCLKGRLMGWIDAGRTEAIEAFAVGFFDTVLLTSAVDAEAIRRVARARGAPSPANLRILCNGVDLDYFAPGDAARESATLVFSGKISYHANVTAVRRLILEIMPLVWERRPDARLLVVGKNPPAAVCSLATRCGNASGRPRVVATGTVADIRPYLRKAAVAVAPIPYGAGVQNKVLEAMACGTPVVASPVAVSALGAQPGADVLVAGDARDFAGHVLRLLENRRLASEIGAAGRRYVEQHHSWDAAASRLETCYSEAGRKSMAATCTP